MTKMRFYVCALHAGVQPGTISPDDGGGNGVLNPLAHPHLAARTGNDGLLRQVATPLPSALCPLSCDVTAHHLGRLQPSAFCPLPSALCLVMSQRISSAGCNPLLSVLSCHSTSHLNKLSYLLPCHVTAHHISASFPTSCLVTSQHSMPQQALSFLPPYQQQNISIFSQI